MRIVYVFCIGFPLYVPKRGFWGFWWWRCKNIVFWPPKGTTLREYASVDVSRVKIGSTAWALGPWKDFLRTKKEKNWVVTLAIWGEVTPGATFTKCGVWGDMVDVITCAIFGDCRLRGVGVVRGVNLPSYIDFTRRPYNTGHIPCDRWPCDYSTVCRLTSPTASDLSKSDRPRNEDDVPNHMSSVLVLFSCSRRESHQSVTSAIHSERRQVTVCTWDRVLATWICLSSAKPWCWILCVSKTSSTSSV